MREKLHSGLLLSIFIVLSFGQLLRISFFDRAAFFPHEVLMILYCIASFPDVIKLIKKHEYQRILTAIGILIIVFGLSFGFEFWKYSQVENLIGLLYFLRLILYLVFFISLLSEDKKNIKQGLTIFTILTIFFSYGQYFLYPNLRNLSYLGWDPHQYRAFGLFFDTTVAGVIYMTLLFIELGKSKRNYFILGALMGLILLSYSRITYLSLIVGIVYYFYSKKNALFLAVAMGFFALTLFLLPRPSGESARLERVFTITARVDDMKQGLKVWQENPILGVGYNRIAAVKETFNKLDHSQSAYSSTFITVLASTGIIGFLAFTYFLLVVFQSVDKIGKTVMIGVVVASLFDNVFLENFVLILFIFIASLSLSRRSQ